MRRDVMRRIIARRFIVVTVAIACLAALATGFTLSLRSSHAQVPTSSGTTHSAIYTLVTGERVGVSRAPDGKPTVSLLSTPATGAAGAGGGGGGGGGGGCATTTGAAAMDVLVSGQHLYVLPSYVDGYIGQPLSIDLFDITAMTPDTSATSASSPVPLAVDYTSDSTRHLPPGLSQSGSGVVVTDRAKFGQALAEAWRTDMSGGTSQVFAGITRVAPTGSAAPTPPPGQLFTVTVKAFDRRGLPATDALGHMMNVDDGIAKYFGEQGFYRGNVAFSVPAGHYSFSADIHTPHPDNSYDTTLAVLPELDVTHDMTVVIEARKGQPISVTTPLPATPTFTSVIYQRDPQNGGSFDFGISRFCDNTPLYATPTSPVSVGKVFFSTTYHLVNSQSDPGGYTYDLDFPYPDAIPSTLAETVTADQLATIHSRYHSPIPGRAEAETRFAWTPGQNFSISGYNLSNLLAAPLERTEYVTARSDVFWMQEIDLNFGSWPDSEIWGPNELYTADQQTQADWMAQPMASGTQLQTSIGLVCPVCRSDDTLTTNLYPFTDNHGDYLFSPFDSALSENLALYQNGTQVAQSPSGVASFTLSPDPANYKLVYDAREDVGYWPTPTHVHTEWSFSSRERSLDQLPPGWTCELFDTSQNCSIESLLFAQYHTSAGLDDVMPAGEQATVDVTLSHQRGSAASPITQFAAQVSYDDGATWQQAPATDQGSGVYRLRYTQPDLKETNGYATLRIQAADAAGNAIDQTITRAYPLAVTPPSRLPTLANKGDQPVCSTPSMAPYVQCMAVVNTDAGISLSAPHGLGPADIQSAYNLSALAQTAGQGRTVAIVDAFDDPNAEADLAAYRAHYGLPACTSANGCFTKVNQRGETTNLPWPDPGWSLEISLDLDAVSATCPSCKILLVEADMPSAFDLLQAVQTADKLGANVISNSYGTYGEFSGEQYLERSYRDLSVPFVVSSGDYGYGNSIPFGGVSFPAVSQYAIAVGGTTLTRSDTPRGWSESAWGEVFGAFHAGATSGCSAYIHKPGWQKDDLCGMRTVADVSAVADPTTGLAVYDTFFFGGWLQVGGTSLSAPIISGVYAMAGDGSTVRYASGLYSHAADLFDVVGGSNANSTQCSGGNYLCTGVPGYDGPTGLGTPNGINAFR